MVALGRQLPQGAWWWRAFVLGVLNIGAFFALLFFAAYRLPGGVAATLGAVQPLLVAAISVPLLGQRLSGRTLVLGVAGVVGVALLVLRGDAALDGPGVIAGLAATSCMAAGVVLTKRWGRPVSLLSFTGWHLSTGGLVLLPLALVVEGLPGSVTGLNVAGFAYLAVVNTALGYAIWLRGIERLPATNASFLALASPVVATVAGWLVLGQSLAAWQLVGMTLALGSLVLAQLPSRRTAPVASPLVVPRELPAPRQPAGACA
jgi:probable blue pigment (indigoidine) exporter